MALAPRVETRQLARDEYVGFPGVHVALPHFVGQKHRHHYEHMDAISAKLNECQSTQWGAPTMQRYSGRVGFSGSP